MGEFDLGNFKGNPYTQLCIAIFLMSTFFTMITLLNMIIAIMTDSFDNASELKSALVSTRSAAAVPIPSSG